MALTFSPTLLEIIYCIITVSLLCGYFVTTRKVVSLRRHILYSFLFGLVFNFFSLSWLYTVYPLTGLTSGLLQVFIIFAIHILASFVSGIPFILVGVALWCARTHPFVRIILIPFTFTFAEILRSLLLSILFLGKESTIGVHWAAGSIGNALSFTPLIELAYIGGVFALTWALTAIVYPLFIRKEIRYWFLFLLLPIIATAIIHFFVPIGGPSQNISTLVVGTSFGGDLLGNGEVQEWKHRRDTLHTVMLSSSTTPSLIVLPEDARYLSYTTPKQELAFRAAFPNTILLEGDTLPFMSTLRNYSLFYDVSTDTSVGRGKNFLFPFNEYMPYLFDKALSFFMGEQEVKQYHTLHTYSQDSKLFVYPSSFGKIGSLVCSEILSYNIISRLKKEAPDLVVLQSYLSVFHKSKLFYMHYFSFTKIAAAQLRVPVIVVAQDGPSMIISPRGKLLSSFEAPQNEARGELFIVDKK